MKKQLFIIMLATTLVATTFVGCSCTGSKTATDTTTESTVESTTPTKNENTTEPEQPTTTVADIETDSNTESTTTEQESTIEEPTTEPTTETSTEPSSDKPSEQPTEKPTEKPTQAPTIDPFMIDPEGSYTDSQVKVEGMFIYYLRSFENGAKRNVVHAYYDGVIDKYYYVEEAGVLPRNVSNDVAAIFDAYYANQNPTQPTEQPTQKPVETPTEKPSTGNNEEETKMPSRYENWGEEDPGDWYEGVKDVEGDLAD